ncbi:hypothetical protein TELCIR_25642 [Teladorsagia circumcincta]|uniref:Transcription initiation factor IIA gamma subunit C-terminal domain-containing protein n=1 Tax=Teladorsagia circumcincta TaxID=45464 RepID=A0A2G9T520_TELCI|nr:hypothetical protein TELCIR_25642 [Teladorsagia circumcincta]
MQFKSDRLLAYRYCDNVWTFILKDIEFHDIIWQFECKIAKSQRQATPLSKASSAFYQVDGYVIYGPDYCWGQICVQIQ